MEEEALSLFRNIEYEGDPELVVKLLKTLNDYFGERLNEDWVIPDEE